MQTASSRIPRRVAKETLETHGFIEVEPFVESPTKLYRMYKTLRLRYDTKTIETDLDRLIIGLSRVDPTLVPSTTTAMLDFILDVPRRIQKSFQKD